MPKKEDNFYLSVSKKVELKIVQISKLCVN